MCAFAKRTLRVRLPYAKCRIHRPRVRTYARLCQNFCAKVERYNMYDPSRHRSRVSVSIRKSRCPARRSTRLRFSLWSPLRVVVVRPRTYVSMYGGTRASESPQIRHRTRLAGPEHALARSSRVDAMRERHRCAPGHVHESVRAGQARSRPHAHRTSKDFAIRTCDILHRTRRFTVRDERAPSDARVGRVARVDDFNSNS